MSLNLDDKKQIVLEISKIAKKSSSAVVADYLGVNVNSINQFRKNARERNVYIRVVKNTLLKRAVQGTDFETLSDYFTGPSLIGFAIEEPGIAGKIFKKFDKEEENFSIRGFSVEGKSFDAKQINKLALIPTKKEARTQVAILLKAPIKKLAIGFNDIPTKLVRVLSAIKEQKSA